MMAILLIILIGLSLVLVLEKIFKQKIYLGFFLPVSILLGFFLVAFELFFLSFLKIEWNVNFVLGFNFLFILSGLILLKSRIKDILRFIKKRKTEHIIFLLIISVFFLFLVKTQLGNEFLHSDGLAYWFSKGSIFFVDKGVKSETLQRKDFFTNLATYPDLSGPKISFFRHKYPILTSLNIAFVYLVNNKIDIIKAKYLWFLVDVAILGFLYYGVIKIYSKYKYSGLFGILVYFGLPITYLQYSIHVFGFSDIFLGAYLLASVLFFYEWIVAKKEIYLIIASFFLAGASFCKLEGFIFLWFLPLIFLSENKKSNLKIKLLTLINSFVFFVSWKVFAGKMENTASAEDQFMKNILNLNNYINRFWEVFSNFFKEIFNFNNYLIFWEVFLIVLLISFCKIKSNFSLVWLKLFVLAGFFVIFMSYFLTPYSAEISIKTSLNRYSSQYFPSAIFILFLSLKKIISKYEKN